MEGEGGDPLSVRKNPKIIKAAQEEVATLDVLVCGTCHYVFHFIEAFQEHKNANECGKPTFKANLSESKPQVWAFLLWKSSIVNKHKAEGEKDPINSWKLYQRWCKMAENTRESWITAGRSIQAFSTLANAKLAEIHSKNVGDTKPRVVTTKAMPLTDDDDDDDDDLRGEEIGNNDGELRPRKFIRKIVRIPIERKDASPIHSSQSKDVRTYSTKKENSVEMSPPIAGKIDLNDSVTNINSDTRDGENKDSALETDKETVEELEAENAEVAKTCEEVKVPEKHADNESKDTDTTKEGETGAETEKQEGGKEESKASKDPLCENMVEIKVEHMSSEEDQNEIQPEPAAEIVKPQVVVPTQRPGTVKRRLLPDGKLGINRVIRKSEKGKDGEASSEDEYVVERILAKRFNPKRKYYEYLLKWEGYPHDQNTWEPVENMAACDKLVETFERNLARQKAMQQKAATQLNQQKLTPGLIQKSVIKVVKTTSKPDELNQPGPSGITNFESRPVRSSKKRALEQVKSWCGSMTKKEFEAGEHSGLLSKSQLPECKEMKSKAYLAMQIKLEDRLKVKLTMQQISKKLQNMKTRVKTKVGKKQTDNKPIYLKEWEKRILDLMEGETNPLAVRVEGKRKAGEESDSDDDMAPDKKIKLEPPDEDWSGGEMGTSMNSGVSSDEDSNEKKRSKVISLHGNQNKLIGILHKPINKVQIGEEIIKRGPGRPPKRFQTMDSSNNTINGITKSKNSTEKDLAVELGLASDSSPEHKSKPQPPSKPLSSQPPVLVANSKGVIKVDPRQVPNLTSGVYIVSNKSGIVKLNDLPSSPLKGKLTSPTKGPQGQKISSGMLITANKNEGIQSGIVRKPFSQPPSGARGILGQAISLKQGIAPRTPLSVNSGLVRITPPGNLNKPLLGSPAGRPTLGSPRLLGPRASLSSSRPSLSMLSQRPGLMQSMRPGFQPRLPGMPLRPSLGSPGIKRSPLGMPGVQNKLPSIRPKMPLQSPVGRGMVRNASPAAQVKSGMKPIHAMLGKAVQSCGPSATITAQQRLILAKKQQSKDTAVFIKQGSGNLLVPAVSVQTKPGIKVDDPKLKKSIGRGRGRGLNASDGSNNVSRLRDSKLVDGDGLHMEFHEVHSSSDSDDGIDSLPELPMGDLPSLEPDSPPRPFTLCPETGKILGRAEGEPTPVPSPEPEPEPQLQPQPVMQPKQEEEAEEILPDKREGSPIRIVPESSYPNAEEETLLKVEMSPGGTTGTVIESNVADPTAYMDTLRTEEGLTVTKISTANTSLNDTQIAVPTSKIGGGISVPARKLFLDSASNNSDGTSSAETGGGSGEMNTELVTITGEDGVVYQIATEEEHEGGEAMLVSADGEQQCVYVTAEQAAGMEDGSVLTLDTAVAEAVAQLMPDQVNVIGGGSGCSQFYVKEGDGDSGQLMITSGVEQTEETTQAQVVAQVVQEGEPMSGTGGTRRVVLLLPDGNLMMTEVDEEQYAALELDK